MARNDDDIRWLEETASAIDDEQLAELDFDQLKARLRRLAAGLESRDQLAAEHARLRDDYEKRIAGMVKAIAAVDRKHDRVEEAVDLVEQLPTLPVDRLLKTGRRISARFRDSFPGSFSSYQPRRGESD